MYSLISVKIWRREMLEIRLPITSVATGIDGLAQLREGGILNWLMDGYLNEREKTARLLEVARAVSFCT